MTDLKSCYACGSPIPELNLSDNKYNFICPKCGCETKPQQTLEKASKLWNDGRIYANEKFYSLIFNTK